MLNKDLIKLLKPLAETALAHEDAEFHPYGWSGGNFNDCYSMGMRNGERMLARQILRQFKVPFELNKKEHDDAD